MLFLGDRDSFDDLLIRAVEQRASDVHLMPHVLPAIRVDGCNVPLENYQPLTQENCMTLLEVLLNDVRKNFFLTNKELDLSYTFQTNRQEHVRCRINIYEGLNGIYFATRILPQKILSLQELNHPPVLQNLCRKGHGLIVVSGPTGSGKTTTIAAMLAQINENRQAHILTLEDPIEYVHQPIQSIISQREVLKHTPSFYQGLRSALREDPDVIFIGEMRDKETIETALMAAETGHLVLTTLHTASVAEAVDRIIQCFPSGQQKFVQAQLANCFEGIIVQRLFKRKNAQGRVAVFEILTKTPAASSLIRNGEAYRLEDVMRINIGMQVMQDSISDLVERNVINEI